MKRGIAHLIILFFSVLLYSCSKEEILSVPQEGKIVEIPVCIEISSQKTDLLQTRAEDNGMVAGTCAVNEILLLIYNGTTDITDITQLTYSTQKTLVCKQEGSKWVARGTVNVQANQNYAIFALAYNSENEKASFGISPTSLEEGITTYGDTKITIVPITATGSPDSYTTPELFAGNVMPKGVTKNIFTSSTSEEVALTGTLYRAVGKASITLTGIPANIKKLSFLTEKVSDWNYLFRQSFYNLDPDYPMGIPAEDEQKNSISEVAKVEHTEDVIWGTTLTSYFIPLTKSRFYIEATDNTGNKIRYLVKCADKMYDTIWIAIIGYGVTNYYFYIKPNYQLNISGTYEQLQFSGSIKIDLSEMGEYDGGLLE